MTRAAEPSTRRLIASAAWLYHKRGLRQNAIAERLSISQSKVSRLLDQAVDLGIVRTEVLLPKDEQSVLESELEDAYGLRECNVYDVAGDEEAELLRELGQLFALQLQSLTLDIEVLAFTSWSRTLQETVRNLPSLRHLTSRYVVQMVGDLGPPRLQHIAAQYTEQLAGIVGAEPMFLRVPGVTRSVEVRQTLLEHDKHARTALRTLDRIDLAFVGIGSGRIVPPLRAGDNFFTTAQVTQARKLGAVGEIDLRFVAEDGEPIATDFDQLIIGVTPEQLRSAERRIGVAGGQPKRRAIRAAMLGGWINSLVTDSRTAEWLVAHRD